LIDNGFTIENIAFICGSYIIAAISVLMLFRKTLKPVKLKN
jgi:hypothetical protein